MSRIGLLLIGAAVLGCNGGITHELAGVWIGRPEGAEARNNRESEQYAERLGVPNPGAGQDGRGEGQLEDADAQSTKRTDWELYDVSVRLEFTGRNRVKMSLGEGSQPVAGTWRVVESTPAMMLIELTTPSAGTGDDAQGDDAKSEAMIRRRFEMQPDRRDGALHGFTLSEAGADPRLGWLYFTRPGGEKGDQIR